MEQTAGRTTKANKRALADLQKQLKETKEQNSDTAQQLEQSKQQVLELQKKSAERILTKDQLAQLDAVLSSSPKYEVSVQINLGDQEALQYAQQFVTAFKKNGWTVNGPNQAVYNTPPKGIELVVHSPSDIPPSAEILARALKQAGISFIGGDNPSIAGGTVEFRIGVKQ
jgi:hypothetical protein